MTNAEGALILHMLVPADTKLLWLHNALTLGSNKSMFMP